MLYNDTETWGPNPVLGILSHPQSMSKQDNAPRSMFGFLNLQFKPVLTAWSQAKTRHGELVI